MRGAVLVIISCITVFMAVMFRRDIEMFIAIILAGAVLDFVVYTLWKPPVPHKEYSTDDMTADTKYSDEHL